MTERWIVAILAMLWSSLVFGQGAPEYRCLRGDLQRRVAIFYETGVAVPCEVHYYKDNEAPGEQQVLWRALNESGYCEARAREFIEQLESWGWSCSTVEAAVTDDTAALAPPAETEGGPDSEN